MPQRIADRIRTKALAAWPTGSSDVASLAHPRLRLPSIARALSFCSTSPSARARFSRESSASERSLARAGSGVVLLCSVFSLRAMAGRFGFTTLLPAQGSFQGWRHSLLDLRTRTTCACCRGRLARPAGIHRFITRQLHRTPAAFAL